MNTKKPGTKKRQPSKKYFIEEYFVAKDLNEEEKVERQDLDIYHKKIVSDELRSFVFDGMPGGLNKLEKALYVYFKLCLVLKYDDRCYNRSRMDTHQKIEEYKLITPENPNVVCADFSAIFAVLLKEIKVEPEIYIIGKISGKPVRWNGEKFPTNAPHVWVCFDACGMKVSADATPKILSGDLAYFKYGVYRSLKKDDKEIGLFCKNNNEFMRLEFEQNVFDMMQYVWFDVDLKNAKAAQERLVNYYKAGEINSRINDKAILMPFDVRLRLLFKIIENVNLHDLELAQYVLLLSNKLFLPQEDAFVNKDGRFKFSFVRNDEQKVKKTETIFAYKIKDENNEIQTKYCILDGGKVPQFVEKKELENKFLNQKFSKLKEEDYPLGLKI